MKFDYTVTTVHETDPPQPPVIVPRGNGWLVVVAVVVLATLYLGGDKIKSALNLPVAPAAATR